MPPVTTPHDLLVLHGLRVVGFCDIERLAEATGLNHDEVESELIDLAVAGLVTRTPGPFGGWGPSEAGRISDAERVGAELDLALARLESVTGRTFGDPGGPDRALTVSVRSGASVSMPGMMDTVLGLGTGSDPGEEVRAAVVARSLGRPAVVGVGAHTLTDGDLVTVDGTAGLVVAGRSEVTAEAAIPYLLRLEAWADEVSGEGPDLPEVERLRAAHRVLDRHRPETPRTPLRPKY